ncbi:hypothetical protein [Deinococcus sp.]|uniref:hypothetical protein n=1 Tax=Deinococcus sp. TaxID=47478 RepID=UPI0028699BE7|nr:hypothetical protein [Deinococcus sp.]
MHVMLFRATIKGEHLQDIDAALDTVFAAIHRHQTPGVRYASSRLATAAPPSSCWRWISPVRTL